MRKLLASLAMGVALCAATAAPSMADGDHGWRGRHEQRHHHGWERRAERYGWDRPAYHRDTGGWWGQNDRYYSDGRTYWDSRDGRDWRRGRSWRGERYPRDRRCRDSDLEGTAIGAVGGGVLGNVIAPGGDKTIGTIAGAAIGGLIGNRIDHGEGDRRC